MRPIESRYKIAPCPFCGYNGELFTFGGDYYFIRCSNRACQAEQNVCHTEENTVARWNRRIDKPAEREWSAKMMEELHKKPYWDREMTASGEII